MNLCKCVSIKLDMTSLDLEILGEGERDSGSGCVGV